MPFTSVEDEMHKFKEGELHSGSSEGKVVTNPEQAIAIALSEKRRAAGSSYKGPTRRRPLR
jgi:hypothetical protein